MDNPLQKNKGTALTPAQVQTQQIAIQQAQKNQQFWFPIQSYFSNRLNQQQAALTEQGRGEAGGSSREQAEGLVGQTLNQDAVAGASAGSGKYILTAGKGSNLSATQTADTLAQASAEGDRAYVSGLEKVIDAGQKTQQQAQQGLQSAAQEQGQEAGLNTQANVENQQGLATLGGLGLSVAAAA